MTNPPASQPAREAVSRLGIGGSTLTATVDSSFAFNNAGIIPPTMNQNVKDAQANSHFRHVHLSEDDENFLYNIAVKLKYSDLGIVEIACKALRWRISDFQPQVFLQRTEVLESLGTILSGAPNCRRYYYNGIAAIISRIMHQLLLILRSAELNHEVNVFKISTISPD